MAEIKVEYRRSTKNIDYFYKTITNHHKRSVKVLDFKKFETLPFQFNMIVSMRGMLGKTYNTKDYILEQYKKEKKISLWLRNLATDLGIEREKFLSRDCPPNYKMCNFKGSLKRNTLGVVDENNNKFINFAAMNTIETQKGSRTIYDYIVWDEFNVNSHQVLGITNKFDDLLHSTEDIVNNYGEKDNTKIFIFGNNKSLNHPLMVDMGITKIENEITEIYVNNQPLMIIIWVQPDQKFKDNFEKDNKSNPRFLMSKLLGKADHSYFNGTLYDEVNFVSDYIATTKRMNEKNRSLNINNVFKLIYSVYHKDRYYNIYKLNNLEYEFDLNTKFHINLVKRDETIWSNIEKKHIIYSFDQLNKKEGVISQSVNIGKNRLAKWLSMNLISFETLVARDVFINSIR